MSNYRVCMHCKKAIDLKKDNYFKINMCGRPAGEYDCEECGIKFCQGLNHGDSCITNYTVYNIHWGVNSAIKEAKLLNGIRVVNLDFSATNETLKARTLLSLKKIKLKDNLVDEIIISLKDELVEIFGENKGHAVVKTAKEGVPA